MILIMIKSAAKPIKVISRDVRGGLFFRGEGRGKGKNPSFLPMRAFEGKNGPFGTPVGA